MTGTDIQQRFEALITDLQTVGKGLGIIIVFRNSNNAALEFPLSSDNTGVIDDAERENLQSFIDDMKPIADEYTAELVPVTAASEAFKTAQTPHEAVIEAARVARVAMQDALAADANYQAAKTTLDLARVESVFVAARDAYNANNVSENYAELASAKGKYI